MSSLWESGWPVSLGSLWGQCVFSSASHIHQEVFYTLLHGQSSPGYDDSGEQVAKESRVSQEHKITLIPHVFSSVLLPSTVPSVCLPRNPLQRKNLVFCQCGGGANASLCPLQRGMWGLTASATAVMSSTLTLTLRDTGRCPFLSLWGFCRANRVASLLLLLTIQLSQVCQVSFYISIRFLRS